MCKRKKLDAAYWADQGHSEVKTEVKAKISMIYNKLNLYYEEKQHRPNESQEPGQMHKAMEKIFSFNLLS